MAETLANKYRPKSFSEVIGQELVVKALQRAIENNMLSQTILFTGTRGIAKTTLCRIIAKELNISTVFEIDCGSRGGVDDIRELIKEMRIASIDGKGKVFIIDEAHLLSQTAGAAMLSILERMPEKVYLMAATTDPQKLSLPIKSRMQRFDLQPLTKGQIKNRLLYILKEENIKIDNEDGLDSIVSSAEGSMRDAITNMEMCLSITPTLSYNEVIEALSVIPTSYLEKLTKAIIEKDYNTAFEIFESVMDIGYLEFTRQYINYISNIIKKKIITKKTKNLDELVKILRIMMDLYKQIKYENIPGQIFLAIIINSFEISESNI